MKIELIKIQQIKKIIKNSIKLRLKADVKVGTMLSGGIDSSVIQYLSSNFNPNISAYNISFKDNNIKDPEREFILETINDCNIDANFLEIKFNTFKVNEMLKTIEMPFRSFTVPSQMMIFKTIKSNKKLKVLLSGEGADEVFSGYNKDIFIFMISLLKKYKFISFFKQLYDLSIVRNKSILKIFIEFLKIYISHNKILNKKRMKKFYLNDHLKADNENNILSDDYFKNYSLNTIKNGSLREYLAYSDLTSMKNSIEVRVPFMDYRVVEYGLGIPSHFKFKKGIPKQPLRQSFSDIVSKKILNRKDKKGFFTPFEKWVKNYYVIKLIKFLENENIKLDFFNYDSLLSDLKSNKKLDYTLIWRIYLLHKWIKLWKIKIH